MKPRLYIETSIVSYLTAQPSRDIVTAARQQITREWWEKRRSLFDLCVSEFVLKEVASGDPSAAALRLNALSGIPELQLASDVPELAEELMRRGQLPPNAAVDALHIATAVSSGLDYLLTWNFKNLANAAIRARVEVVCRDLGYEPCIICTPEELLED